MTPKEKAIELVNKFKPYMDGWRKANYFHFAKQCALIAVDEILESFPVKTISDCEKHDYWVTVKTEIENL